MHPRQLQLHHKTCEKLLRLMREAEKDGEYRIAKRIHAVLLNVEGYTSGQIARILKIERRSVTTWLAAYELNGMDGILEGKHTGRPASLDINELVVLENIIESGPIAYGYSSGIWDAIKVSQVIFEEFGVSYDPRHVRRILDRLSFSVQRPAKTFSWADPLEQDKWRRYKFKAIKKRQKTIVRP